ncbi:MAG: glycerophosphodiester phosphodiesterase [Pirellulaceae bacterium]|nr:glycerophosphodiester phosphodiesterase [Planctomycetales bacterium]
MRVGSVVSLLIIVLTSRSGTVAMGSELDVPMVIAHRGASGYVVEHTLPAKAMAHAMGADYIEQDLVLTKDDQLIVLHDIHLDLVTDVAERFPGRARSDGHWYAIDFVLDEVRQLSVHERVDRKTGKQVFPGRFPLQKSSFRIATFSEELELIQGLNATTGRNVGVYPEIKSPAWHRQEGKEISPLVLAELRRYGYLSSDDHIYLQCFDPAELRLLREKWHTNVKLVQLIGSNSSGESAIDYDAMRTDAGLAQVATYANAIGPSLGHLWSGDKSDGRFAETDLVTMAHRHGLQVHPYTVRADDLPNGFASLGQLLSQLLQQRVDGVFTDHPDQCRKGLGR